MAEGGGLLNRYRVKSSIGGSNPPLSARRSNNLNILNHLQRLIPFESPIQNCIIFVSRCMFVAYLRQAISFTSLEPNVLGRNLCSCRPPALSFLRRDRAVSDGARATSCPVPSNILNTTTTHQTSAGGPRLVAKPWFTHCNRVEAKHIQLRS